MIDERAIIDPTAKLADDVVVGPYSIIGPHVEIGSGTWIGPHATVMGPTKIGANNKIFQYASIGESPQDKKYHGEDTELIVGDDNIFREFCTVNRGTIQGGGLTKIGDGNLFMNYTHVAHDCIIGNNNVFSNNASLAGHVTVEDYVIFGGFSAVHQYCKISSYAFLSKAMIGKDVLPFIIVQGTDDTSVGGINSVGLRRNGFAEEAINQIKKAYKIIFRQGLTIQQAIEALEPMALDFKEIQLLIDAMRASTRGILR